MYKVQKFEIDGFWHRIEAQCDFSEDVNIIIGKNGTGKTTFMNILHAVLIVDIAGLSENDFDSAKIILIKGANKRTISVKKIEDDTYPFPMVEYKISNGCWKVPLMISDNRRVSLSFRRRQQEEINEIRQELDELVSVSSLSVYRLRSDDDYEVRDRHGSRILSPVDYRLGQALRGLTQFQLEVSEKAQLVSEELQKEVLASILYSEDDAQQEGWELNFEKDKEQTRLVSAYTQLNSLDSIIRKKIRFHVSSIDKAIKKINNNEGDIDIKPLEALRKTRKIIDLSLDAQERTQHLHSHINMFLNILSEFIEDKEFSFSSGQLSISNNHEVIDYSRLSSGEKQLIILMVEALLQKQEPHIFLADEPELSLHIAWQKQIIPAIRRLNPNGQVIVATHSPEVAAKFRDSIYDMEEILHG